MFVSKNMMSVVWKIYTFFYNEYYDQKLLKLTDGVLMSTNNTTW